MAFLNFSRQLKSNRASQISATVASNGQLRIYTGPPPASPDIAATGTLLATLACSPSFGTSGSSGVVAVTVTNGGSGYTSPPTVIFGNGGGSPVAATATAVVENGVVTRVIVTSFGSGYPNAPTVSFTGGGGTGATATSEISPVMIANAIAQANAVADGVAGYARVTTSAGAGIIDLDVTGPGGGGSVVINTVNIVTGGPVQCTSFVLAET